ncbi:MAG: hypothetical protein JWP02_719 [Acidimicrobiales bacterium]|nr:hypothetical protein [Acidimicrobiales bacterium]
MNRSLVAAAVIVLSATFAACSGGGDSATVVATPHRTLVVNDSPTPICAAVATSVAQQVAGLSHRPSIPAQEGMAFPFSNAQIESFTMKDTAIPLSIVWVGTGGAGLGSTSLTPFDETSKPSPGPIVMAVELSPPDWGPMAATARTMTLGQACDGTITAGLPGSKPSQF